MKRLLILGGTAEGAALARALAGWPDMKIVTSLAGRTRSPETLPAETRIGGFGGPNGLAAYLQRECINALIDATHPFAEQISRHAFEVATRLNLPHLQLIRPPWERQLGDEWIEVADMTDAAGRLPGLAKRVFLTIGHRDLGAFAKLDDIWFLIRTIEPVKDPLPRQALCQQARGPFDEAAEVALMREHRIDALVTKASGGDATYAKIAAARRLGLPVIMIERPPTPPGTLVHDVPAALARLRQICGRAECSQLSV